MAIASEVTAAPELGAEALKKFEAGIHGEVFRPGHPGYDPARTVYTRRGRRLQGCGSLFPQRDS